MAVAQHRVSTGRRHRESDVVVLVVDISNFSSFDILLNFLSFPDSLHSKGSRIHGRQASLGEFCRGNGSHKGGNNYNSLSDKILWQQMVSNGHGKIKEEENIVLFAKSLNY